MPPEDTNTNSTNSFGVSVGLDYDPNAYDLPNTYAPTVEPNPMVNSDDPVLKILGYIQTADQVLDRYVYTAQESDQAAIAKLRAQAALEAARAAQVGAQIKVEPVQEVPWLLIIGGGAVLVGLFFLLRKED